MKQNYTACGIIVEYNPFHNGHIHHINQAKTLSKCDVLIAVMSPNFVQRGEPSFINKWVRTQAALDHGVDIIIELPTYYVLQSAQVFACASVSILNQMQVDSIVFGSESNNLSNLKTQAFNKDKIKDGYSYAASFESHLPPNDILGVEYLRAMENTSITPYTIQRTNAYLGLDMDIIASGSAIRNAHKNSEDIEFATPLSFETTATHSLQDYQTLIQYKLQSTPASTLKQSLLMDEGIENLFKKNTQLDINTLIATCTSKRYTQSRIKRTLMNALLNQNKDFSPLKNFRILGLSQKGIDYLNQYKKINDTIPFTTQFKEYQYKDQEYQNTFIYACVKSQDYLEAMLKREVMGPIIKN